MSTTTINGIRYTISGSTASVTGYTVDISANSTIQSSVSIGGSSYLVTSIGTSAFLNCIALTWIIIPNSVTSIGNSAFNGCTALTSVTIGNSVTSIGTSVFQGCTALTSITIPNLVTTIGTSAFNGCNKLTSIIIPNSVTSIGASAFLNCSGLTSVTIGNSLTSIGTSVFQGCTALTSIIIPNSVTSIGTGAFLICSGLTSVTIGNSVTSIGPNAFRNCSGLISIIIPNSVTSIGNNAFQGCTGLTSVTIGNSVTSIGISAFNGCNNLTSITFNNQSILATGQGITIFLNTGKITKVSFNNTVSQSGLSTGAQTLKSQIDSNNSTGGVSNVNYLYSPTITNFTIPEKTIGDDSFQITDPSSNSDGSFSYISSNLSVATISGDWITIVGVGTSKITATQAETPTYASGTIDASFTVIKATPTITNFSIPEKTVLDTSFQITDPSSNSTGSFSYTSSNLSVATISGDIITIVGVGSSIITATQAETPTYASGTIDASFTVIKGNPTITNFAFTQQLNGTFPFQIIAPTSNSSGSFSYTSSDIDVATISGDIITIVGIGSSIITATQAATANFNEGTIDASFIVTNPVIINDSSGLLDFMNATDFYGVIENNIIIDYELTTSSPQKILVTENENVKITSV